MQYALLALLKEKEKLLPECGKTLIINLRSVSELKDEIRSSFNDKLAHLSDFQCGYMEKTVKRWIECDKDIDAMYGTCKLGDEILLWCDNSTAYKERKNERVMMPLVNRLVNESARKAQ